MRDCAGIASAASVGYSAQGGGLRQFEDAVAFDQDISGWEVGAVENMSHMFASATAFDQDIGGWDVGVARHRRLAL